MIIEELTKMRDSWRVPDHGVAEAWVLYDFVLAHGQQCKAQALPARYRKRQPKACFYNSSQLVRRSKRLRYVEGYALHLRFRLAFEHAWAIDPLGRVIEPTLSKPLEYEYFGVPIERTLLRPEWRWTGVFRDEIMARPEVLRLLAKPGWTQEVLPLLEQQKRV